MPRAVSRRHFLLSSAAVSASAVVVGGTSAVADGAHASSGAAGGVHAGGRGPDVEVDTHPLFVRAGRAYGVPPALLAAFSYTQSRWQDHDGRPSSSLGYGPMHLVDGAAAQQARERVGKDGQGGDAAPPVIDTLAQAAQLSGVSLDTLRTDPAANIRGAAALLAYHQRAAGHPVGVGTDPSAWFAAVAETSGLTTPDAQLDLADTVLHTLREGGRLDLATGESLHLSGRRTTDAPSGQRTALARRAATAQAERKKARNPKIDAPPGLSIEWHPAGYAQYGRDNSDYGNHDLAHRPRGPVITHIIIHDTEGPWNAVLNLVSDPTYVSWQYSLRSSDGHIAQHVEAKDIAWHCGNWWMNMHSIGLEHEGYAAQPSWFSESMYRTSAALVRYLAQEYTIPLDRAHVLGHDQVPGTTTSTIPAMHVDPGPFWDWEHYFSLLGAPLSAGTTSRRPVKGDVVRILPGFAGNNQMVTGCQHSGQRCSGTHGTNFVTLRQSPSASAPLARDAGQHPGGAASTNGVYDVAARATAGVEYVVAKVAGDWTAIWFAGGLAWFLNPRKRPTARVVSKPLGKVQVAAGAAPVPVYGRCYPEASAYYHSSDYQEVESLLYRLQPGQEYAVGDLHPKTDYFKARTFSESTKGDHVDIRGKDRYVQISLGHRVGYVRLDDVRVVS